MNATKKPVKKTAKAVVVTTENRGVFFGYVQNDSKAPAEITLTKVRMCVYWSTDVRGVLGLAATGPTNSCRVTHSIPQSTLYKVTAVLDCDPQAVENWEKSLWK